MNVRYTQVAVGDLDLALSLIETRGDSIVPDPELAAGDVPPLPPDPDHPLNVYLREVAKVPPMTSLREGDILRQIRNKPLYWERAQRDLVEGYLAMAVQIARQYRAEALQAIQKGNEGLITATDTFAAGHGYGFSTYASFCVHRSLHAWLCPQP